MQNSSLYFIALIPPDDICREVHAFKEDIARQYNSIKSLKIIPHITLKAPFTTGVLKKDDMIVWFNNMAITTGPFETVLDGFSFFDNPKNPVIFVKPMPSTPLHVLQKEVIHGFQKQFPDSTVHPADKIFHPHMTIAYRDLAYAEFINARKVYEAKTYNNSFITNALFLLKHNSLEWKVVAKRIL